MENFEKMNKLYHYTTYDTALKILKSGCLKFGRLNNMNDIHENDKLVYEDLSKPVKAFSNIEFDCIMDEVLKYRQISFSMDDNLCDKKGFDLHQMWGIYANKGNGVCLVFDKDILEESIFGDKVLFGKVSYDPSVSSEFIATDTNHIANEIKKKAKHIYFHKRLEWRYENEYRIIKRCTDTKQEDYLPCKESLKYVIFSSFIDYDAVLKQERITEIQNITSIPILIYGNGLLEYSLYDFKHLKQIWTSTNDYNIPIVGTNCELDI